MTIYEFKKEVGDPNGNYPELICDEYCKYPGIVMNEGWEGDAFFDELNRRYCCDCPIIQLFLEYSSCDGKCPCDNECLAYQKGYNQGWCDA